MLEDDRPPDSIDPDSIPGRLTLIEERLKAMSIELDSLKAMSIGHDSPTMVCAMDRPMPMPFGLLVSLLKTLKLGVFVFSPMICGGTATELDVILAWCWVQPGAGWLSGEQFGDADQVIGARKQRPGFYGRLSSRLIDNQFKIRFAPPPVYRRAWLSFGPDGVRAATSLAQGVSPDPAL
jgi:hypothetical protein